VIREVDPADLDSREGRVVVEAARRLGAAGRPVGLSELLLELPDPMLQSLLVAVDEERAARGPLEPAERIGHLADALRRRAASARARASARAIKTSRLDSQSEAELLERLVAQRRAAQGMSEPKEG
jgi:predicted ATPase with chaperone activity